MQSKRINTFFMTMFAVALFAALPAAVRADGGSLTLSSVSGGPGTEVTVYGTVSNSGSSTLFLNGESFTLGSSSLQNGDVTDFFLNAPFFLVPDSNSGSIALFQFKIAPGTPGGIYTGNFLDILGGAGVFDQNVLATANFSIDVKSSTVREPGDSAMLMLGLVILAICRKYRPFRSIARSA